MEMRSGRKKAKTSPKASPRPTEQQGRMGTRSTPQTETRQSRGDERAGRSMLRITTAQERELQERFQHVYGLRVTVGQPGSLREGTVVGMELGTVTAAASTRPTLIVQLEGGGQEAEVRLPLCWPTSGRFAPGWVHADTALARNAARKRQLKQVGVGGTKLGGWHSRAYFILYDGLQRASGAPRTTTVRVASYDAAAATITVAAEAGRREWTLPATTERLQQFSAASSEVALRHFGGVHNVPRPIELALARPPSRPIQYYQIGELTIAYRLADSGGVCASSFDLQQIGLAPALRARAGQVRTATLPHCRSSEVIETAALDDVRAAAVTAALRHRPTGAEAKDLTPTRTAFCVDYTNTSGCSFDEGLLLMPTTRAPPSPPICTLGVGETVRVLLAETRTAIAHDSNAHPMPVEVWALGVCVAILHGNKRPPNVWTLHECAQAQPRSTEPEQPGSGKIPAHSDWFSGLVTAGQSIPGEINSPVLTSGVKTAARAPSVPAAFIVGRRTKPGQSLQGRAPKATDCQVAASMGAQSSMAWSMQDDMRTLHAVFQLPGAKVGTHVPTRGRDQRLVPGMEEAAKTPGWRLVFVGRRMQLFGIYRRQPHGEPARWERHATQFGHDECETE